MSKTVSVFFNVDRAYVTMVDKTENGLELLYLNSTQSRIDLENPTNDDSVLGIQELKLFFSELKDFDRVTVTLPAENVLVTKFPGNDEMTPSQIRRLVDFELKQNYPQFNYDDFTVSVTTLSPKLDNTQMMLAVIIPNQIYLAASDIVATLGKPVDSIEISQLNAHTAFMYNYPEHADKNAVLLSIQNQFIDVSLSKNGQPAYYSLVSYSDVNQIPEIVEREFEKIKAESCDTINYAFYFGAALTKDVAMMCWETAMLCGFEGMRLNAFRMMKTNLGKREREYCSRTLQLYPPCIGGALPYYHKRIKLF